MRVITTILLAAGIFSAYAQKLPSVQKVAVRLPAGIKIDGKADELGARFEAYNPATEVWYTIANDDKRLYLAVQANNPNMTGVVNRIIAGGLTFTIVNNQVKDNKGVSVTYPVKKEAGPKFYIFNGTRPGEIIVATDSLLKANNLSLERRFKFIKVSGVKDLDTISVYNDEGIEAVGRFDIKNNYTIEMSIPLELIHDQINTANTFSYKITISGGKSMGFDPESARLANAGNASAESLKMLESFKSALTQMGAVYSSSTNFSGVYTLAK